MEILIFIRGCIFIRIIQPIIIIRMIVFIVLLYSYFIYKIINTYWFRYALVIVILRGVIVLFTYIISLFPNESFESYNLIYIFIFILLGIIYYFNSYDFDIRYISFGLWISFMRIFNLFIVFFLLRIIIIVVWFRYIEYGAVRVNY